MRFELLQHRDGAGRVHALAHDCRKSPILLPCGRAHYRMAHAAAAPATGDKVSESAAGVSWPIHAQLSRRIAWIGGTHELVVPQLRTDAARVVQTMSDTRPVVVHPEEAVAGPTTPGLDLRHRYDAGDRWIGWTGWIRNDAGDVSHWHHHAANDTYVYVIRGSVTIEFGPGGNASVEARAGDFFVVPPQTVHREMTGPDSDLEVFVLRIGSEPEQVDVVGPEGAGR